MAHKLPFPRGKTSTAPARFDSPKDQPPPHHDGPAQFNILILPTLLEAKHVVTALTDEFSGCTSVAEVFWKFVSMDEATSGGVLLLLLIVVGLAKEHTGPLGQGVARLFRLIHKKD